MTNEITEDSFNGVISSGARLPLVKNVKRRQVHNFFKLPTLGDSINVIQLSLK